MQGGHRAFGHQQPLPSSPQQGRPAAEPCSRRGPPNARTHAHRYVCPTGASPAPLPPPSSRPQPQGPPPTRAGPSTRPPRLGVVEQAGRLLPPIQLPHLRLGAGRDAEVVADQPGVGGAAAGQAGGRAGLEARHSMAHHGTACMSSSTGSSAERGGRREGRWSRPAAQLWRWGGVCRLHQPWRWLARRRSVADDQQATRREPAVNRGREPAATRPPPITHLGCASPGALS